MHMGYGYAGQDVSLPRGGGRLRAEGWNGAVELLVASERDDEERDEREMSDERRSNLT